ncbi:MAG: alanine--tRNA ligase [Endomicrobium sp.]|jgi:alanyl-tRNA synthetase|nr:alanine--tRNA ligase [Endomicrobium sp.]
MKEQSSKIRLDFLEFFKNNGCVVVPSDSLVPKGDKTLLFTSAGMVQFKKHFLGQSEDSLTRVATCQKCFRMSDIEQVGVTARHLTFFEMLGNFSFGDYFKKEAVAWAWEFLTKNISLPKDRLYITVYKDDNETAEIWSKVVSKSKIVRLGEKTNFWNMGSVGPCGPCSEILIDLGTEINCRELTCGPDCNCGRFFEIWNLVFTQFDRQSDGSLKSLPRKNIDTGMGLERIVAVANGKKNVFETDLFMPIIENASEILKLKIEGKNLSKLRMIADHVRAVTFLISDGILPSNEGRGYVLRRVLRRALRCGKLCGCNKPFINELCSNVFKIMESTYSELSSKSINIKSIVKIEEEKFLETLESGSKLFFGIIKSYKSKGISVLSGKDIFKLYDTYGFPCDLTREIAFENGLLFDEKGFKTEQKIAQEKSRATWSGSGEKDVTFYSILHKDTNDTVFLGYNNYFGESEVLALLKDKKEVDELKAGDVGEIVLSKTSFYAQSGGQVADKGRIINSVFESTVEDVFKPIGNLFVHKVKVLKGFIKISCKVLTLIDIDYRKQISRHHTATHILHNVLREFFGKHVTQAGSFLTSKYLRFDFIHFSTIGEENMIKIEKAVNFVIRANLKVCTETMEIDRAHDAGAVALFDEKYGNIVRTVSIKNEYNDGNYSIELCGGTHVDRTGDIGIFKIVSMSSIAASAKRIEAVVGVAAENYILNEEYSISKVAEVLNVSREKFVSKVQKYVANYKNIERELGVLKYSLISNEVDSCDKAVKEINGIKFLAVLTNNLDMKDLRIMINQLNAKLKCIVLLLASKYEGRVFFVVSVSINYVQKGITACKIAKAFAIDINGFGNGKSDFAQGGSKDISKLSEVMKGAEKYIRQ